MIKESELDSLSISWAMARTSCLLSKQGTVVVDLGAARDGPAEGPATLESASGSEIDECLHEGECEAGSIPDPDLGV